MSKDGGAAFPVNTENVCNKGAYPADPGMSLRDFFAAKAMHAELMTCGVPGEANEAMAVSAVALGRTPEYHMACNAYQMADAMLKARES